MIVQNKKSQSLRSQYGQPTLRLDKLVPTGSLEWKLGQIHVGTSNREVLEMVDAQLELVRKTEPRWTERLMQQTRMAALWIHREHLLEYQWVMGSH